MAPTASDTLLLYFEIEQRNCLRSDKYPFQPPPPPKEKKCKECIINDVFTN